MYMWKMALRRTQPQTKAISAHFPKPQKNPCISKSGHAVSWGQGITYLLGASRQSELPVLYLEEEGARKSLSKQALQSCLAPEMGKEVYLKNNILLEAEPVHRGHCSICEPLAVLQRHGLS